MSAGASPRPTIGMIHYASLVKIYSFFILDIKNQFTPPEIQLLYFYQSTNVHIANSQIFTTGNILCHPERSRTRRAQRLLRGLYLQ